MRLLTVCYDSALELIESYQPDPEGGVLAVETSAAVFEGELLVLDIRCPELPGRLLARGACSGHLAPGRAIIKLRAEDHATRGYLMALANGDGTSHPPRRHERFPLELPVTWRLPGVSTHRFAAQTADVSSSGAFIPTAARPSEGAELVIELTPPGGPTLALLAHVVRTHSGDSGGGMALAFDPSSVAVGHLRRMIRDIDQVGAIP